MKCFAYIALFFWSFSVGSEPITKVIISVKHTKLNNQNKAAGTGFFNTMRGIEYRLKNMSSGDITSIRQKKKMKVLNLVEGDYCFTSKMHDYLNQGEYQPILNPICFTVLGSKPINTGTWLIGHTMGRKGSYALIIGHEENYDELADKLSVKDFEVPKFSQPNKN